MSIRLPPVNLAELSEGDPDGDSASSSSMGEDDDQNWDDWVSDSLEKQECPSLFDDVKLPSAKEAIEYDKGKHSFDLDQVCSKLGEWTTSQRSEQHSELRAGLDFHGRIRLINYLRKNVNNDAIVLYMFGLF